VKPYKFIISGGGTGGHLYPAIAIADKLKQTFPDTKILFVGAYGKMEMQQVPKAGYSIKGIWISGFQRGSFLKNMLFPFKLIVSFFQSVFILLSFKPDFAIGTGGFASGPILLISYYLKIKTLIQEQNSYPGITNKLLSKRVDHIGVAFEGLERFFPKHKITITGNPIREALVVSKNKRLLACSYFNLDFSKRTLVVLGGSLGAKKINQIIAAHLYLFSELNIQLIWQCGKSYYDQYKKYNQHDSVQVHAFIQDMDLLYAAADFLISRAGASSISELAVIGKPVILIPSPNVADNHQLHNAQALAKTGGALMLIENDIDQEFEKCVNLLLKIDEKLVQNEFVKFARPKATQAIVDLIINNLNRN
tara:strand:- start:5964 stop:7055 length:1092 start_codon:yes stop_codon:yes gene_type:complete